MEGYFEFLDDLRESGDINMYGAAGVLVEVFDITKQEAREILSAWMKQFRKEQIMMKDVIIVCGITIVVLFVLGAMSTGVL